MSGKILRLVGWFGVGVLILALVVITLYWVPKVTGELREEIRKVEQERKGHILTLNDLEVQFKTDEERYAGILRRFPWLIESSGGTAFLTRLGDIITGLSLKVQAIGALQREKTPQLEKIGRPVRLSGRFSDILTLLENAEQNKGVLEELKIQRLPPKDGQESQGDLEAQFRLSTIELSPDFRQRLRALSTAQPEKPTPGGAESGGPLLLPMPERAVPVQVASLRDPFMMPAVAQTQVASGGGNAPEGPPPEEEFPPLTLAGIMESPAGRTAILNNQLVKVGDRVEGVLVQAILKNEVVLKSPFAVKRLALPEFGSSPPPPGEKPK